MLLVTISAIFLLSLLKTIFFSQLGFGLLDEGENLHNGLRILNGDLPYRDFYTLLPPLDNFWPTLAFKIFGVSVFAPRLLSSLFFSFLPVVFFLISKRSLNTFYSLIPSVSIIFMDLNIERIYYFSFLFWGFFLFLVSLDRRNYFLKILAGLLLGIGAMVRLDQAGGFLMGIFLGMAIYTLTIASKDRISTLIRTCLWCLIGFILVMIGLCIWVIQNALITPFLKALFINSLQVTRDYALSFPLPYEIIPVDFSPTGLMSAYSAWFIYLILITYLGFGVFFIKNWRLIWKHNIELGLLFFIGLVISPYMLGRAELAHFTKGGLPFLFLGTFLLSIIMKPKNFTWIRCAFFLIPLVIILFSLIQSFWWIKFNNTKLIIGQNHLLLNSDYPSHSTLISAETIKRAVYFVNTNTKENEPFLALPYMAGLYFLTNRPSQTYVDNIFTGFLSDEKQFINRLEYLKINVVIYDPVNGPKSKRMTLKSYYPNLDAYLMNKFDVIEKTKEGWLFMRRKV